LETTGQVYGFGASSIGQFWGAYAQNLKDFPKYIEAVEQTGYAIERGYKLSRDEQIIRSVVNSIMCNGVLVFEEIADQFQLTAQDIKDLTKFDPLKFEDFILDGLMVLDGDKIRINEKGFMFARNIAMALDPAYNQENNIYSKTV
jgi:oxygen-independent coproporphyrinogen-3 oxidase